MTRCNVLGPVELTVDGRPAPATLFWRKNLALLVYLARAAGRAVPRDHLVALFWGNKRESSARHSLNEAVFVLRDHLGAQAIQTERDGMRLGSGRVLLDTDLLEDRLEQDDVFGAAELVRGEFMQGFSIADCWDFDEWLSSERTLWRERCVHALVSAAHRSIARGSTTAAATYADRASRLDGLSEPALRARMLARTLEGDRAGALLAFDSWRERTAREYALEPSQETEDLAERIRREKIWRPPALLAEQASSTRRWPLVGRASQLEALLAEWRECVQRAELRMVAICGAPGMGRSRLGEEVLARARLEGAHVSVVRAVPSDRTLGASALPLLPSSEESRPASFFFDDVHWLGPDSIRTFHALARDGRDQPVFLMLSATVQPSTPDFDALCSRIGLDIPGAVVHLEPLSDEAVRQLAQQALPSYAPEDIERLTRRVQADCAGIPFLVTSVLTAVVAGLELAPDAATWPAPAQTLDDTLPVRLAETAVAAIRIAFWQLSEAARNVLIAAAVAAEPCSQEVLIRATSMPEGSVEDALDELEWKRWLAADLRGYTFVSRVVREVVATQMTTAGQRRRLVNRLDGFTR